MRIVRELCDRQEAFGVIVKKNNLGTSIIDAGIKAKGGFLAGKKIIEVCLGGLGQARLSLGVIRDLFFPFVSVI